MIILLELYVIRETDENILEKWFFDRWISTHLAFDYSSETQLPTMNFTLWKY